MTRKEANLDEKLIDRIYEAAVLPDLWSAVLDDINVAGDGHASFLFAATKEQTTKWITSAGGDIFVQAWQNYLAEGGSPRNDRAYRLIAAGHPGFLGDLDVYTREEMDREPVFTHFLRPRGWGWGAATAVHIPNGNTLAFSVERRLDAGPVDRATVARLDALRPHLARAALVSSRLAFERARAAVGALDVIGLPAAVLSDSNRILAANPRLEAITPDIVQDRRHRVALADRDADALLAGSLARLAMPGSDGGVRSLPVPASHDHPPMIVHLIPIRLAARDIFYSASAILVVTPVTPAEAPAAEILQGLFDLTPAEARVARGIAECQTVEQMAASLGVSRETVRSQLKAALAKTGTVRQTDLAALLLGASLPRK